MKLLILFFVLSIVFSFLCSIWEAVLLSITPSYINRKAQENTRIGKDLLKYKKDIDRPLSAILTFKYHFSYCRCHWSWCTGGKSIWEWQLHSWNSHGKCDCWGYDTGHPDLVGDHPQDTRGQYVATTCTVHGQVAQNTYVHFCAIRLA